MRKFHKVTNRKLSLAALMLSLNGAAFGCAGVDANEPSSDGKPAAADAADPVAAEIVAGMGLAHSVRAPAVAYLGQADIVSAGEADAAGDSLGTKGRALYDEPVTSSFEDIPETEFEVVDFASERRYHVSLSEENIAMLEDQAVIEDDEVAGEPLDVQSELFGSSLVDKAVLGGTDTRQPYPIPTDPVKREKDIKGWLAAVGLLDQEGCTGTLISSGAYVTAAHCVYTTAGQVIKRDFFPRADQGSGGVNELPWGIWTATQVRAPAAYVQNKCYQVPAPANCGQYDVAVVKVTPDANNPGLTLKFAMAAESRATLLTRPLRNVGYPLCDQADRPASCGNNWRLFGDAQNCALGRDVVAAPAATPADPTPVSPLVEHTCDTSKGHSGGPMFYYRTAGAPMLIGVHVESFQKPTGVWTNRFKRFGLGTLTFIRAND